MKAKTMNRSANKDPKDKRQEPQRLREHRDAQRPRLKGLLKLRPANEDFVLSHPDRELAPRASSCLPSRFGLGSLRVQPDVALPRTKSTTSPKRPDVFACAGTARVLKVRPSTGTLAFREMGQPEGESAKQTGECRTRLMASLCVPLCSPYLCGELFLSSDAHTMEKNQR